MLRQSLRFKPPEPKGAFRKRVYDIVNHQGFEIFITICILLNTLLMSMRYARMSDTYELTLEFLNYVFGIIFNIEMILKLIGIGVHYFKNSWDKFDFVIVIGTDIGFLLSLFVGFNIATAATIVRAFRILRIFRLMKSFGKMILDALIYIIPQITNIMSLIFLLLFIYSCLGISLFATTMYRENYNRLSNFRNFYNSIIILLR
jgi:voltage-gated sodium channel type IV alpha